MEALRELSLPQQMPKPLLRALARATALGAEIDVRRLDGDDVELRLVADPAVVRVLRADGTARRLFEHRRELHDLEAWFAAVMPSHTNEVH